MAINDDVSHLSRGTHVFMLRLWLEDLGDGQIDWRGKVQHVNSGEARYFRDWPTLDLFVEKLMLKINPEGTHPDGIEDTERGI